MCLPWEQNQLFPAYELRFKMDDEFLVCFSQPAFEVVADVIDGGPGLMIS
jgi:hypothetical protein